MSRSIGIVMMCALFAACHGDAPRPATEPGIRQLKSGERLGWDQKAENPSEAAAMHFVVYIDGTPADMLDVSCKPAQTAAAFSCSGRLPAMALGVHTLQLASLLPDGTRRSTLSEPLRVEVGPSSTPGR